MIDTPNDNNLFSLTEDKEIRIHLELPYFKSKIKDNDVMRKYIAGCNFLNFKQRRIFHKPLPLFLETMELCFREAPAVAIPYMEAIYDIRQGMFENSEEGKLKLVDYLVKNICNAEGVIKCFADEVTRTYTIEIEGEHQDNQLQFKDSYARALHRSAYMMRLLVPLLNEFMVLHNIRKDEWLFLEAVGRIFDIYNYNDEIEGERLNLANKIQKFVEISVSNTLYSDKVIWAYLENQGINDKTVALDIHRNIMCNILPKLEGNRSIVSFFVVVIRHQLRYQFTAKFKTSYRPLSVTSGGNNDASPFMRIEQHLCKSRSELELTMNRLDLVEFIEREFENVEISKELLDYYTNHGMIFTTQTKLVDLFVARYVGRGLNIGLLSRLQYIKLCLIVQAWMNENGFPFLAFVMLGRPLKNTIVNHNFKRAKSVLEVTETKEYQALIKEYAYLKGSISSDIVLGFIAELINSDFEVYILPDGTTYEPSEDVPSIRSAIVELINFIKAM